MPVEIERVRPEDIEQFVERAQREALKTFYDFSVIWHEQRHDFAAMENEEMLGVGSIRIAASLATVEQIIVRADRRRQGIGRELLLKAAEVANYYNCHKMTVLVPHHSAAQAFFEHCGYHEEAVLPQHTFKLDMAALRKFLL